MSDQKRGWVRDFFGPLRAWLVIGVGFLMVVAAFALHELGASDVAVYSSFVAGVVLVLAIMAYLVVRGRQTSSDWLWFFKDDSDLSGRRRKD